MLRREAGRRPVRLSTNAQGWRSTLKPIGKHPSTKTASHGQNLTDAMQRWSECEGDEMSPSRSTEACSDLYPNIPISWPTTACLLSSHVLKPKHSGPQQCPVLCSSTRQAQRPQATAGLGVSSDLFLPRVPARTTHRRGSQHCRTHGPALGHVGSQRVPAPPSQYGCCKVISSLHPGFAVSSGCLETRFGQFGLQSPPPSCSRHSLQSSLPLDVPELLAVSTWSTPSLPGCSEPSSGAGTVIQAELGWEQHHHALTDDHNCSPAS